MNFENLKIISPILEAIKQKWYTKPTPIQSKTIPALLEWRDLLWCAQTWTWKTAAFAIPILQLLYNQNVHLEKPRTIKALIITPTRELAIQIHESFSAYWKNTNLRFTVLFGWVNQNIQVRQIKSGVDILVATPGRLLDLVNQKIVNLGHIKVLTLDEADRMLDMGFIHDVKKIISKLPARRQTMLFSATMPAVIANLASSLLRNPIKIEVTPVASTVDKVDQIMYMVEKKKKKELLSHLLNYSVIPHALVFCRTKHWANKIALNINKLGIKAEAIHSNKSQNARQMALENFKSRKTKILVATDIASRGIDIDDLSHVINFDIPNEPETYVHRIWRTGRAERTWIALSFCDCDEQAYVRDIHKLINRNIPVSKDHPYHIEHWPVLVKKAQSNTARSWGRGRNRRR